MTCEEVRIALGAHALGALDPEEALEINHHLATCEACGAELEELAGLTSFLGKVSERDVEVVTSPPRQVLDRLLNDRARRSRRGRILTAVAACAAVLVVGGTVWTSIQVTSSHEATTAQAPAAARSQESGPRVLADQGASEESAGDRPMVEPRRSDQPDQSDQSDQSDAAKQAPTEQPYGAAATPSPSRALKTPAPSDAEPRASPAPRKAQEGREFTGENRADGYRATVQALPAETGTELGVRVTGIPVGTTCGLVVVAADGRRETTQTWQIAPDTYRERTVFSRRTSLALSEITHFEVVDDSGNSLLKIPAGK
ncbi:zf-HC2 domain-containing protein [Nonomuraea sp. NPDC049504]|uniref:anti-sigma factor family protein n=1 Tax=Nonomuraea sp. NPDC049504 TaxID=3154729 RepID=UPI00341308E9